MNCSYTAAILALKQDTKTTNLSSVEYELVNVVAEELLPPSIRLLPEDVQNSENSYQMPSFVLSACVWFRWIDRKTAAQLQSDLTFAV
jgi:hypothetical protein